MERNLVPRTVRVRTGSTVEDLHSDGGSIRAVRVSGRWFDCRTLLVAAGSLPELSFLADSGLLRDGALAVAATLQTVDPAIFGAGDAVTIVERGSFTPWTWPQAVVQGRLAAANLYAAAPLSLACLSRVNAMNLNGLSLAVLGAPVPGALRRVFAPPGTSVFRELYLVDGRIVGGALVGDIAGAGRLHSMMSSGERVDSAGFGLLAGRQEAFATASPHSIYFRRRAVALPAQGG